MTAQPIDSSKAVEDRKSNRRPEKGLQVVHRTIKLGETSLDIHVQQPVTLLRLMSRGDSPFARLWTPDAAMGPPHEHGVIEDPVVLGRIL